MAKLITTFFTNDDGVPLEGLTPTIRIRDLSNNSLVVTDAVMGEVGDGGYKYSFVAYDPAKAYQIRCDAGVEISGRYAISATPPDISTGLQFLVDIEGGNWKLDTVTKRWIYYAQDGITPLVQFNVFNKFGVQATENVYRRERVL